MLPSSDSKLPPRVGSFPSRDGCISPSDFFQGGSFKRTLSRGFFQGGSFKGMLLRGIFQGDSFKGREAYIPMLVASVLGLEASCPVLEASVPVIEASSCRGRGFLPRLEACGVLGPRLETCLPVWKLPPMVRSFWGWRLLSWCRRPPAVW